MAELRFRADAGRQSRVDDRTMIVTRSSPPSAARTGVSAWPSLAIGHGVLPLNARTPASSNSIPMPDE